MPESASWKKGGQGQTHWESCPETQDMVSSGAVCQPAKGKKAVRVYGRQERDKTDVVKETGDNWNYPQIWEADNAWEFVLEGYDFIYQGMDCSGSPVFWNIHLE